MKMTFPAVTVCNNNAVMMRKLMDNQQLRELVYGTSDASGDSNSVTGSASSDGILKNQGHIRPLLPSSCPPFLSRPFHFISSLPSPHTPFSLRCLLGSAVSSPIARSRGVPAAKSYFGILWVQERYLMVGIWVLLVYNAVIDNTVLSSFVQLLVSPKSAISREILWKF